MTVESSQATPEYTRFISLDRGIFIFPHDNRNESARRGFSPPRASRMPSPRVARSSIHGASARARPRSISGRSSAPRSTPRRWPRDSSPRNRARSRRGGAARRRARHRRVVARRAPRSLRRPRAGARARVAGGRTAGSRRAAGSGGGRARTRSRRAPAAPRRARGRSERPRADRRSACYKRSACGCARPWPIASWDAGPSPTLLGAPARARARDSAPAAAARAQSTARIASTNRRRRPPSSTPSESARSRIAGGACE